jgi:hypothetical protein
LTNNAVQKNAPNYGNFEDGNQLSFPYFSQYIKDHYPGCPGGFERAILPKMKYFAAMTMAAVKRRLNPNKRRQCFEIFGYDYIIDSDFNVWLIEVNTNPCIEESSNLLKMLLPRMLDDAFRLTLDVIYPPPTIPELVFEVDNVRDSGENFNFRTQSKSVNNRINVENNIALSTK